MAKTPLPPEPAPEPPTDPRRNWRSDGRAIPLEPGFLARVTAGVKRLFSGGATPSTAPVLTGAAAHAGDIDPNNQTWMGPGTPLQPVVQNPRDVAGRATDYPVGYNVGIRPRRYEGIDFEQLRRLADGLDLVRLCIETRKDQMAGLTWSCLPRQAANQQVRGAPNDRCRQVEEFMRLPDKRQPFHSWMRQLVEEQLTIDAPAIYVRKNLGGELYSLEVVRGSDISVLLDKTGRTPLPPQPAYQQILKGVPAIDYTTDELIYWPRNLRPGHFYGCSPVQQIIMTVNIAIRREIAKLSTYTEGNIPEALIGVPENWTPEQIERFQAIFDAASQDQRDRKKARFVPGGMQFQPTRGEQLLMNPVDEWLARVICYCFSLPPLPLVQMMNRATSETSYDSALQEGLQPMMVWFKSLMDRIIQGVFGFADLEFVWDDINKVDPVQQGSLDLAYIQQGVKGIDEVRADMGLPALGIPPIVFGVGPLGFMAVSDIAKAIQQGLALPAPAPPPDMVPGMPGAPPGLSGPAQPSPMIGHNGGPPLDDNGSVLLPGGVPGHRPVQPLAPAAAAALAPVNPKLLAAVGLGAADGRGRRVDVTQDDELDSDPLSNVVAHPAVLKTLRDAERRQGRGR